MKSIATHAHILRIYLLPHLLRNLFQVCCEGTEFDPVVNLFMSNVVLKTNHGSETVIPLYITGCREKIYSESAVVAKRRRLIRAIYFLPAAGDIKRDHCLRTVISLVSGFFLTLYACREIQ